MRAVTYHKNQDSFQVETLDIPDLETEFDVVVKVKAVGLNPVDSKIKFWHSSIPDMDDHFVGGLDVSGEIVALGDAVSGWHIGDAVLYHGNMRRHWGGFAEFAVQDSRALLAHPKTSPEIAAATPCAAWTAYRALVDKMHVQPDTRLFIAGGSGGVGSYAIAIAKALGVKQIITSCSAKNVDYVKSLGATHVIDYHKQDVAKMLMELTQYQGVTAAFDCVGGEQETMCARALAFDGQLVELVQTADLKSYDNAFMRGLSVHQLSLGAGYLHGEVGMQSITKAGRAVSELLNQGAFNAITNQAISLEQIPQALMDIRQQRTQGKLVAVL